MFHLLALSCAALLATGPWRSYEIYQPAIERHFVVNSHGQSLKYNHDSSIAWFGDRWFCLWNANEPPAEGKDATILTHAFVELLKEHGRNPERKFMTRFTTKAGKYVEGIKQLPLAMKMWKLGRLQLGATSIRGIDDLRKIMDAVEAEEGSS